MKQSDYLVNVQKLQDMGIAEGGDIDIEEKCRRMIKEAIRIMEELCSLDRQLHNADATTFLQHEWNKLRDEDIAILEQRFEPLGRLMVTKEKINTALNHIFAVSQSLHILTQD